MHTTLYQVSLLPLDTFLAGTSYVRYKPAFHRARITFHSYFTKQGPPNNIQLTDLNSAPGRLFKLSSNKDDFSIKKNVSQTQTVSRVL